MSDGSEAMWRARLAVLERQRAFEWELAIGHGERAGAAFARQHMHDLANVVQVVELGLLAVDRKGPLADDERKELFGELHEAARQGKLLLNELRLARATLKTQPAAALVEPALAAALALVRPALPPGVHLETSVAVAPGTRTACTDTELEQLVVGAVLDAVGDRASARIGLTARVRRIEGKPWLELLCEDDRAAADESVTPRVVAMIVARAGGEVSSSATRAGGTELVIAVPLV